MSRSPGNTRGYAGEADETERLRTKVGVAQSGAGAVDEWDRSDDVHSGRRPQPAGALDCADPGGACEGSAGRALSRRARNARCNRGREPPAGTLEIRREETEEKLS